MNKKIISAALAALMMCSTAAIAASADEVKTEAAGAAIGFQLSGETGTIKFNMGDWNHDDKLAFYMWAEKEGEATQHCFNGEWGPKETNDVWGSKKNRGTAVEGEDGIIESYEFELPDDSWDVYVIFHDLTTDAQTANCVLTANGMGKTAYMTGNWVENPVDSEKVAADVAFEGADDCGSHMMITSTGKITGSVKAPNEDGALAVAQYLYKYLGVKDKNGEECVTEAKVADAISSFGTTADDVWAKFQTFKGQEGYEEYDAKEADAKKFIKPTEEKKDEETDSDKKDSDKDNNSSNSSSKSSTTTTTGTSTTKSTTTTSSSAAGTASTEAAAATGDTTNTAAFAVVFLAAAAAMFFARKKVEE